MKRMIISVDGSDNDRDSISCAATFCRRVDGRLSVVHPREQTVIATSPDAPVFFESDRNFAEREAVAKAAFDDVCGDLSFAKWESTDTQITELIRDRGMLYDAIIIERVSSERGPEVLALNTALFESGAPVLVAPPGAPAVIGKSVAVVWNRTIQSARAVRSALPILARADEVEILVNRADGGVDPVELQAYLECHGIVASARTFGGAKLTARGRGRAIIAAASASADLLVMGAYGENRLSVLLGLGRATQKIVSATPIPALIQT
jgi:nucleotide-binding universal stress UspA family protein